ncbi:hypothetical protein [Stenotrophomonas rhizophila]|uniref:hypothetical protein n=1 Tax=Stenotrophomonas rhizophila TaxID=216778 RepID=UPI0011A567AE|nr:hypothetical protein [Stenotrophomonas rhizophila]
MNDQLLKAFAPTFAITALNVFLMRYGRLLLAVPIIWGGAWMADHANVHESGGAFLGGLGGLAAIIYPIYLLASLVQALQRFRAIWRNTTTQFLSCLSYDQVCYLMGGPKSERVAVVASFGRQLVDTAQAR